MAFTATANETRMRQGSGSKPSKRRKCVNIFEDTRDTVFLVLVYFWSRYRHNKKTQDFSG